MNENSKMNKKNEWLIFSPFVIKWFNCKQTFGDTITCTLQQTDYNRWISETVACDFFFFFSCCFVFSFSTHWVWSSINSSFYTWSESYQMNFIIKLIKTKKMLVYICICVWFSLSLSFAVCMGSVVCGLIVELSIIVIVIATRSANCTLVSVKQPNRIVALTLY